MTTKELFEAIGLVDDALVLEADAPVAARPRPTVWQVVVRRWAPLAACLCVAAGAALAWRGGLVGGGAKSGAAAMDTAPRSAEPAPAAEPGEGAADAGGAVADKEAGLESAQVTEDTADAAYGTARPEEKKLYTQPGEADGITADAAGAPPQSSQVFYWGSQLEPALQTALWGEGEAESWQDVLAGLPGQAQPEAEPATLPVLRDGKSLGQYALCSRAEAQALLSDGAFLSKEAVPRGAANPANTLDAELVYNPAGAALRVPMWAFTVPTDMAYGDVVCYVPAVDLDLLRQLLAD